MFKKLFVPIFLVLIIGIWGCATVTSTSSGGGTSGGGREYFPNTNGDSWVYNIRLGGGTPMTLSWTFSGSVTAEGKTFQVFKGALTINPGFTAESYSYVIVSDTNVKMYYGSLTSEATVILTFPLNVGNRWYISGSDEAQVLALETVTVPAGTFNNCYKVRYTRQTSSADDWYAPNVGLIKEINSSGTLELVSKNF